MTFGGGPAGKRPASGRWQEGGWPAGRKPAGGLPGIDQSGDRRTSRPIEREQGLYKAAWLGRHGILLVSFVGNTCALLIILDRLIF